MCLCGNAKIVPTNEIIKFAVNHEKKALDDNDENV